MPTTPIVIAKKDVPTNPFDPTRVPILLYNEQVDIANAWNLSNALSYSSAMHSYIDARANIGGPPPNMTQPTVPLYRHILADGTSYDGPEPVIDPIPLPALTPVSSGGIAAPSVDPVQVMLAGLQTVFPMIQQISADVAAIKGKVGA